MRSPSPILKTQEHQPHESEYADFRSPTESFVRNVDTQRKARDAGELTEEHLALAHTIATHTPGVHFSDYERYQMPLHHAVRAMVRSAARGRGNKLAYNTAKRIAQNLGFGSQRTNALDDTIPLKLHDPAVGSTMLTPGMNSHERAVHVSDPRSPAKLSRIGLAKAKFMGGFLGHSGACLDTNVLRSLTPNGTDEETHGLRNWVRQHPEHYRALENHLVHNTTAGKIAQQIVGKTGVHKDFVTNAAGFLAWQHQQRKNDLWKYGRELPRHPFHGGVGGIWDQLSDVTKSSGGQNYGLEKHVGGKGNDNPHAHFGILAAIGSGLHSALCGNDCETSTGNQLDYPEDDGDWDDSNCQGVQGLFMAHLGHHLGGASKEALKKSLDNPNESWKQSPDDWSRDAGKLANRMNATHAPADQERLRQHLFNTPIELNRGVRKEGESIKGYNWTIPNATDSDHEEAARSAREALEHVHSLGNLTPFVHAISFGHHGFNPERAALVNDHSGMTFDGQHIAMNQSHLHGPTFSQPGGQLGSREVMAHEVGHTVHANLPPDLQSKWQSIHDSTPKEFTSQSSKFVHSVPWKNYAGARVIARNVAKSTFMPYSHPSEYFPSEYGSTDVHEDFAESFSKHVAEESNQPLQHFSGRFTQASHANEPLSPRRKEFMNTVVDYLNQRHDSLAKHVDDSGYHDCGSDCKMGGVEKGTGEVMEDTKDNDKNKKPKKVTLKKHVNGGDGYGEDGHEAQPDHHFITSSITSESKKPRLALNYDIGTHKPTSARGSYFPKSRHFHDHGPMTFHDYDGEPLESSSVNVMHHFPQSEEHPGRTFISTDFFGTHRNLAANVYSQHFQDHAKEFLKHHPEHEHNQVLINGVELPHTLGYLAHGDENRKEAGEHGFIHGFTTTGNEEMGPLAGDRNLLIHATPGVASPSGLSHHIVMIPTHKLLTGRKNDNRPKAEQIDDSLKSLSERRGLTSAQGPVASIDITKQLLNSQNKHPVELDHEMKAPRDYTAHHDDSWMMEKHTGSSGAQKRFALRKVVTNAQ